MRPVLIVSAFLLFCATLGAHAATITILNADGAGEGFNDPTPAAPVGGNPGTTVGQQRLNVFQRAGTIWGGLLPSNVNIVVRAQFNAQTCTATSAVLAGAAKVPRRRSAAKKEGRRVLMIALPWFGVPA